MIARHTTPADLPAIGRWIEARGYRVPHAWLQAPGWIVDGLAAVWVWRVEGAPLGIMEALVSNPDASSKERNAALDEVVRAAMRDARDKGIRHIVATTHRPEVVARAQGHGFKVLRRNAALISVALGG